MEQKKYKLHIVTYLTIASYFQFSAGITRFLQELLIVLPKQS